MFIEKMQNDLSKYLRFIDKVMQESRAETVFDIDLSFSQKGNNGHNIYSRIYDWFIATDGKLYAYVLTNKNERLWGDDFTAYNKLVKKTRESFTKEQMDIISRNYTKYMLWLNLSNRIEYRNKYIHEQIYKSSVNLKKLTVEQRKEYIANVKMSAGNFIDELTREICDEMFFYTFFKHCYSVGKDKVLSNPKCQYTNEEREFFDKNQEYMIDLIQRVGASYCDREPNQTLYYHKFTPDVAKAVYIDHNLSAAKLDRPKWGYTKYMEIYVPKMLKRTSCFAEVINDIPFQCYVDAYQDVYENQSDISKECVRSA